MKALLLPAALLLTPVITFAQGVGIGTTAPDASAALEIASSSKGVLLPRVASANSITSPAPGLLVYQTNAPAGFYYNAGTNAAPNWQQLATVAAPGTVASVTGFAGLINIIAANASAYVFAGPTALITITSAQSEELVTLIFW
ncbi:hypothetical protein [Hymenobacter baengnokdamensis]|uniref:hypothetical protein n=1 Tax=Hymenobacter baengnokdamensis TaxID=2615203 RepID=UPI0012482059|nr:hypothetical protein [Hymenobacter baengnokdamensis]